MKLQTGQIIAYYTAVLGRTLPCTGKKRWIRTECPFHSDNLESVRINTATGEWSCLCGEGSIHHFQMKRAYSDDWDDADYQINKIIEEGSND